jgi:hypothetical protein
MCRDGMEKSRRMKGVGCVALWETRDVNKGFLWEDLIGGHHLEDLGIDWRMILKWIFSMWNREAWSVLI